MPYLAGDRVCPTDYSQRLCILNSPDALAVSLFVGLASFSTLHRNCFQALPLRFQCGLGYLGRRALEHGRKAHVVRMNGVFCAGMGICGMSR